jgi:hypothetical protein
MRDSDFRERLFAEPDRVLGRFDLTQAEVAALRTVDAETLDALAGRSEEDIAASLAIGLYAGMLSAGRHLQESSDLDRADCGEGSLSRNAKARVVESKRFLDWSQDTRKEVRAMKKWKLLSVSASMVAAVLLLNFAVTATRVPSETVDAESAEVPAKVIAVSSDDDMYGPPAGAPNVYESVKRKVVYVVYNPGVDDSEPWFELWTTSESAAGHDASLPEPEAIYGSPSEHNTTPALPNSPREYVGYNPLTDPYDPWLY